MARVSRAFVIANEKKPVARQIKKEVRRFLLANGVRVSPSSPQLVITVGGDGTVLFSKKYYGIPFFAIGSATSFICQSTFSSWKPKLCRVLRNLRREKRLLLSSSLNGKALPPALNEVGIRNPQPRVLSIHLKAGKSQFAFRADGFFISTPTGSPAYCYSCGGREMGRSDWRVQAVAISPFRRLFQPKIYGAGVEFAIRVSGREQPDVFLDGRVVGKLSEGSALLVKPSKKPFYFAKA